jgi:hypothetical protein
MPAVLQQYGDTGEILGKGTDDLGYDWPLDGRYGPGITPHGPT